MLWSTLCARLLRSRFGIVDRRAARGCGKFRKRRQHHFTSPPHLIIESSYHVYHIIENTVVYAFLVLVANARSIRARETYLPVMCASLLVSAWLEPRDWWLELQYRHLGIAGSTTYHVCVCSDSSKRCLLTGGKSGRFSSEVWVFAFASISRWPPTSRVVPSFWSSFHFHPLTTAQHHFPLLSFSLLYRMTFYATGGFTAPQQWTSSSMTSP